MLDIKVLGPGCDNCKKVEAIARQAVMNLGAEAQFEKVTSRAEYPKYGLMYTPGLVVNGKLVCGGRIPTEAEVMTWLADAVNLQRHMTANYPELRQHLEDRLTQFGREMPGPMTGFARLHKKAVEDGALSAKVKELMALAISVAVGCEGCIAYHTYDAITSGATRAELLETIGVGVMMAGGPGTIYAAHALDAVEQFLSVQEPIPAATG